MKYLTQQLTSMLLPLVLFALVQNSEFFVWTLGPRVWDQVWESWIDHQNLTICVGFLIVA